MGEAYPGMLDVYIAAVRYMRDHQTSRIPKLWVYGKTPPTANVRAVERYGLDNWIVFKGRVPYERSRVIIQAARALLVLVPHRRGHETWVPSKLYSYLFSLAPILAIAPEGDVSRIVEKTGRGIVLRDREPARIAHAIVEFFKSIESGTLDVRVNEQEVQQYRMDVVISRMHWVLRRCLQDKGV
jgi:hypothetical protein